MSEWSDGYRAALADVERLAIRRDAATPAILLLVSDLICDALVVEREQDNRIRRRRFAAAREAGLPLFDPVLARRQREVAAMSEHDRDLAEAIYAEITCDASVATALDAQHHDFGEPFDDARHMRLVLSIAAANAIAAVLARRQREAARTGPWGDDNEISGNAECPGKGADQGQEACSIDAAPSIEEIIWVMCERIAHLEIHRGRGRIAARIHELECMRAALRKLQARTRPRGPQEEPGYPGSLLPPKRGAP